MAAKKCASRYVYEPRKRRPVLYDVDVAVAVAGLSSVFAAIAAGRRGARTLLVDRAGVTPRKVDIRKVQKRMVNDGIVLGEPDRLKKLGVSRACGSC